MSPKQFLALILFYMSYLFFGASVYYTLEQELETVERKEKLNLRLEMNEFLLDHLSENETEVQMVLEKLSGYCSLPVTHPDDDQYDSPYIWTFYHAFYFVFTVVSTVGYGNISPNSTFGRMFMILYAIVGLPLNAIMFANLGEIFGATFEKLYRRYKDYKMSVNKNYVALKMSLIAQVFLYLVPGILIFIFLPACVFSYFEKWPYEISVYYSFVTLTTIGFGDYATSFQAWQPREFGGWFIAYEIFIIIWFIFGLGYLVMIMGYLIKAYKSKRMLKLEHNLSMGLKDAQNRIWSGVTSDINYLRKILNEISLARVMPIYVDDALKLNTSGMPKSNSCPDLTIYREDHDEDTATMPRRFKRAYSECPHPDATVPAPHRDRLNSLVSIVRTQSDSDLIKIDRKRTFAQIDTVEPNDLLAKVASALGQLRPETELQVDVGPGGGIHGFSDSQILASERTWGGWSNAAGPEKRQHRHRAASETKLPHQLGNTDTDYEWTWSGANDQINDLRKLRQKSQRHGLYRASLAPDFKRRTSDAFGGHNSTVIHMPNSQESTVTSGHNRFLGRFNNIFRKRAMSTTGGVLQQLPSNIHEDAIKYLKATSQESTQYLNSNTYGGGSRGRISSNSRKGSIFESLQSDNSQILENTTIADLIKVLEAVHTQAALKEDLPRRKLGTANKPQEIPSIFGLFDSTHDPRPYETYNPAMTSRRGSMFPSLGSFHASSRRGSIAVGGSSSRRGSLIPQPPSYSSLEAGTSAAVAKRRFSVRPTALNAYSPQNSSVSSLVSTSSASQVPPVTRRKSLRPSPLTRDHVTSVSFRENSRFPKPKLLQRELVRQRHESVSNFPTTTPPPMEKDKKRYDSK